MTSTSEFSLEEEQVRTLKNPYRDRSLDLNVFQIYERIQLSTRFDPADVAPVLVLEFERFRFDNAFVRNNIAFLREHLLEGELLEVL